MRLFRRNKKDQIEAGGVEATDETGEEAAQAAPGEQEPAKAEGGVTAETAETAEPETSGDAPDSDGSDDAAFFDLEPDRVASYKAKGYFIAPNRTLELRPFLKGLGVLAAVALIVGVVYLLWPSSTARVPSLVGKTLTEAMELARADGFRPSVKSWSFSERHSDGTVLSQEPGAARSVKKGSAIVLEVSKGPRPEASVHPEQAATTAPQKETGPYGNLVICIDPGNQPVAGESEWVDPGMTAKAAAEAEFRGTLSGNVEYLVNMDIASKLKNLLEKDGIKVVITRDSSGTAVPEITRAEIGNTAGASLCVKIHCANSDDPMKLGIQTFYPEKGKWTDPIYEKSKAAALYIHAEMLKSCATEDMSAKPLKGYTGFEWSAVPVVRVEPGFLSNPRDDSLLAQDEFRWKAAWGIRNGIIKYATTP